MGTKIAKIEYYLPETVLANAQLEQQFQEWSSKKIEKKTGIRERHIISDHETALDLAYHASEKVLHDDDRTSIDFLLLCTQSPDYFLPPSACILQDRLGLKTTIGAFDMNLGCSGFIYGLAVAKGLIRTGIAKRVLVVMAETYSKYLHPGDKANRTIFGDGAAATLVEWSEQEQIREFSLGTDGRGYENLIVRNGAARNRYSSDPHQAEKSINGNYLYMNGPEIFNFTIEAVPKVVEEVLQKNAVQVHELDYVIFHQANKFMNSHLREKIGIPEEKFYNNMLQTGNTVSVTIPIALKNCLDHQIIRPQNKILLVGFGVGYSWGGTIIEM